MPNKSPFFQQSENNSSLTKMPECGIFGAQQNQRTQESKNQMTAEQLKKINKTVGHYILFQIKKNSIKI